MGCLMNVLWLVFGGIFTAVEYMIASLLIMITIVGIPFHENGGACFVAFRQGCAQWRPFKRMPLHSDECIVDFSGRNMDLPFAFRIRNIAVHHYNRYSFRHAAF